MLTPKNKQCSFTECLFSLLQYYKAGNTQVFISIIDKVIEYCGADVDREQRKYLRHLLFERLRLFGLLEAYWENGTRRWIVAGNRFIAREPEKFLLFGDLDFQATAKRSLNAKAWSTHELFVLPNKTGINLSISISGVNASLEDINEVSRQTRCEVVSEDYLQLMQLVPPMSLVETQFISSGINPYDIQAEEVTQFDFYAYQWVDTENVRNTGYYRMRHIYGHHLDFVIKKVADSLLGFEVKNREWSFLLASQILNKGITWTFSRSRSELLIPAQQILYIPMLLKRTLCLNAFRWSELKNGQYVFEGISWKETAILNRKFPMIGIINVT